MTVFIAFIRWFVNWVSLVLLSGICFLWVLFGGIAVLAIAVRKELFRCCVVFFSRKFIGRNPG
jgi:hypothetical protein